MSQAEATPQSDAGDGSGERNSHFDVQRLADRFPAEADTMLADIYLQDCPESSARLFRVYKPVPAHFHRSCDEYLYVVSGRGTFWTDTPDQAVDCSPGQLICFNRGTVHSIPTIAEQPLVFLAIDAPRREPTDVTFIDDEAGSPDTFMARNAKRS